MSRIQVKYHADTVRTMLSYKEAFAVRDELMRRLARGVKVVEAGPTASELRNELGFEVKPANVAMVCDAAGIPCDTQRSGGRPVR